MSVGFACNNACAFCAQGDLRAAEPARDVVSQLSEIAPGEDVAFVGGEPTLRDELPDWIGACEARGAARVVVQTNGRRLAYRAYAERLARASRRLELEVSLHGSSAAMHDYHTEVAGSFAQTLRGLVHARALGVPRRVVTLVTRSNFRHLVEVVRLAHSLGASGLLLSTTLPLGRARGAMDRLSPAREMVEPLLRSASSEGRRLGLPVVTEPRPPFVGLGEVEATPRRASDSLPRHPT